MSVRGSIKTNCSLTQTCNFVGQTNNKTNEEVTQFTNTSSINRVWVETYLINLMKYYENTKPQ
jgi:hypothetical protein